MLNKLFTTLLSKKDNYILSNNDAFIFESYPDTVYNWSSLELQKVTDQNMYVLIDFDVSHIIGKEVKNAKIRLFQDGYSGAYIVKTDRITSTWNESTVTYNTKPTIANGYENVNIPAGSGWCDIDITQLLQDVADGGAFNGVYISMVTNDFYTKFLSKEVKNFEPRIYIDVQDTQVVIPTKMLLDDYTTILGWDYTQLKTDQTKCLRVRRDSDNAEQDINYSDGYIDYTSMVSFVGVGNNGYVTTLYDCNGLHDLVQTTLSKQPLIVENGVFLSDGIKFSTTYETNLICDYFDGLYVTDPPFSVYSNVWNYSMDNQSRVLFQDWNSSPKWGSRINTGGYQYQIGSSTWIYGQHIVVGSNICMFNWVDKNENGFIQYSNNYDPIYDTAPNSMSIEDADFYIGSLPWDAAGDFQFKGFAIFPQTMDFTIFEGV